MTPETAGLAWPGELPVLTDGSVTLRAWEPGDAADVFAACQDAGIQRWTRVPVPYEEHHAAGFVGELAAREWSSRAGAPFAVVSSGNRVLGSFSQSHVAEEDLLAEVGYWVAPWGRGQGVGRRSIRLLCDWALHTVGFARLELYIEPENVASQAVAEGVGAQREGLLRSRLLIHGIRRDATLWAVVKLTAVDGEPGSASHRRG